MLVNGLHGFCLFLSELVKFVIDLSLIHFDLELNLLDSFLGGAQLALA